MPGDDPVAFLRRVHVVVDEFKTDQPVLRPVSEDRININQGCTLFFGHGSNCTINCRCPSDRGCIEIRSKFGLHTMLLTPPLTPESEDDDMG